jgi:hypothetical protein
MTLLDLLNSANSVTDEDIDFDVAIHFINDCIAKINIECDANYPTYTVNDETAILPIPEKWQTSLFVPFISARIKQIDASKFEFEQFFFEFDTNLKMFKAKYQIPSEYLDADNQTNFAPDFTGNWNVGSW